MAEDPSPVDAYRDKYIRVLRSAEHIRQNPGMYIGSLGPAGLFNLLLGLVRSSLAEARRGRCRSLRVAVHADGSAEVADDGPGLPPEGRGVTTLENAFIRLTGCSPDGRNWLDYATAAALSEWLHAETRYGGDTFRVRYGHGGLLVARPSRVGPASGEGLSIHFRPDRSLFGDASFDVSLIRERLRTYAFLHPGMAFTLADGIASTEEEFVYEGGLRSYVEWLDTGRRPLHPEVLVVSGGGSGVRFNAALRWCEEDEEVLALFANGEPLQGGSQVAGLWAAVTRSLNRHLREHVSAAARLTGPQARAGLTAALAVWGDDLQFEGATRSRLYGPEPRRAVEAGVGRFLRDYFRANPETAGRMARAAAARMDGPPMTEAEWRAGDDPRRMLRFLNLAAGRRKLVLFLAACIRVAGDPGGGSDREAVMRALEGYADASPDDDRLQGEGVGHQAYRDVLEAVSDPRFGPAAAARLARRLSSNGADPCPAVPADILREMFGNPYRPASIDSSWLTSPVVSLARQAYDRGDFAAATILADALQDAGCEDEDILSHLRGGGPHVRGCWAVDLLLGRQPPTNARPEGGE